MQGPEDTTVKTKDPLLLVLLNINPHKTHIHTHKDIRQAAVHVPFSFNFIEFVVGSGFSFSWPQSQGISPVNIDFAHLLCCFIVFFCFIKLHGNVIEEFQLN